MNQTRLFYDPELHRPLSHAPRPRPRVLSVIYEYAIGDRVTGVPGRVSHGWHGEITRIDYVVVNGKKQAAYIWVHWQEREEHEDAIVRRHAECGALPEHLLPREVFKNN